MMVLLVAGVFLVSGVAEGRLTAEDRHAFLHLVLKANPLPPPRFAALVTDFASIARGEASSDVLLGYQL